MSHEVNDRFVPFVANSAQYGQGKLCDVVCQRIGVEARQVGDGAAPADDDNHVPPFPFGSDGIEGGDDAAFSVLTLHDGGKEAGDEAIGGGRELMTEVAVARCRRT